MRVKAAIIYYGGMLSVMFHLAGQQMYEWAVVGGGVGGIVTVGVLRSVGVPPERILWVDSEFGVGRMGKYYGTVPANNKAKRLVEFVNMCDSFQAVQTPAMQRLRAADPEKEYPLQIIIDPLQDITNYFLTRVASIRGMLTALDFNDDRWHLTVGDTYCTAQRVVLATGSHPRPLNLSSSCPEISLEVALNRGELAKVIAPDDTVAVIGGAHSAVLVLKFLCDLGAVRIINFYKRPLYYLSAEAQALRDTNCVTVQGDPLMGIAAQWAREVLDKNPPGNLLRVKTSDAAIKAWLPICTKVIYAAGFEPNPLPPISGIEYHHDGKTGIIGPHLFGIGIAFPEFSEDGKGNCSFAIGLRDFMRFAQKMVPEWMHKDIPCKYELYDDFILFNKL